MARASRALCLVGALAAITACFVTPLDALGRSENVTAHVAQHLILGDLAAPLLLIGLPAGARRRLGRRLRALTQVRHPSARVAAWALSPVGALLLWTVATYAWYTPMLQRLATPGSAIHILDHVSFLTFGLLIWLAPFDVRPGVSGRRSLRDGGLPWWARHAYAMGARVVLLPAAMALWFVPGYQPSVTSGQRTPQQADAAGLMIGFEMMLFTVAFVLAFVFFAVHEGRRLEQEQTQGPRP